MGAIARESGRGWMRLLSILWAEYRLFARPFAPVLPGLPAWSTPDIQPDLYSGSDRL